MFNIDPTALTINIIVSIIGMAYISYGKKNSLYFVLAGIGLLVYSYFVTQVWLLVLIGMVLIILPFIINKFIE
jgi:hypothetical protein